MSEDEEESLYERARLLPPAARAAFLDDACGDDPARRDRLASLLAHAERGEAFFELLGGAVYSPRGITDEFRAATRGTESPGPSTVASSTDPMIGRTFGRYLVLSLLGRGGMGTVYAARDTRLGRDVALKFLPHHLAADAGAEEQLLAEARAAAALEHPNVCVVHEIGETDDGRPFIAMARYEGETLRQRLRGAPLPVDEAVGIAVQIARGLAAAHARGIIHRDVKPGNVMLTPDGTVKLLDFGIARFADATLTSSGATPGTVAYMSPEQTRGASLDRRSDLWSLGVVLYEMLAGQRPFRGGNEHALMEAVVNDEPEPVDALRPETPEAARRVVERLLRKDPAERYASADELLADLTSGSGPKEPPKRRSRWVAPIVVLILVVMALGGAWTAWHRSAGPDRSIVVLPFVDMSADTDDEYFSDGLTEEIITRLASVPGLKVISRTSAMHYKGTRQPLREIARQLDVAHVLEGSVRQTGARVRITAQLIDAGTDEHLWAQNFDREIGDVLQVQDEIASEVASALEVELGERERRMLVRRGTRDSAAHELYRRGRFLWNTRTVQGHQQALEYFGKAIERDSSYADAYAAMADVYLTAFQLDLFATPEDEAYSRLTWASERALALDEESADAHTSFAIALMWQRNWPGASREFRRAIELNPGHATARSWYSLLLRGMGRSDEALRQSRHAAELDPFAVVIGHNYGWNCYIGRDFDCAVEQFRRSLEIRPYAGSHRGLGMVYSARGLHAEAIREVRQAVELAPQRADFLADLAYVQARGGQTGTARETLRRAKAASREPFNVGRAYVALGESDSAFAWLARANWRWPHRAVRSDPALDPLRSDPRFATLASRIEREMGVR
jgi:serine/threonine-protein kinase